MSYMNNLHNEAAERDRHRKLLYAEFGQNDDDKARGALLGLGTDDDGPSRWEVTLKDGSKHVVTATGHLEAKSKFSKSDIAGVSRIRG